MPEPAPVMRFLAGNCLVLAACQCAGAETIRLNEVLAHAPAGWLELANPTDQSVDLAGWEIRAISASAALAWTFGPDSAIGPSDFWLLPEALTGLHLPVNGGRIELRAADGALADALEYGSQLPRESVGRNAAGWVLLAEPSPGHANGTAAPLGQLAEVRLNEWCLGVTPQGGWLELHNRGPLPASLASAELAQFTPGLTNRFRFAPLSFIEPFGWQVLSAKADSPAAPDNVGFALQAGAGALILRGPGGEIIDQVTLDPLRGGFTTGRLPDGAEFVGVLSLATPDAANQSEFDTDGDGMPDGWEARFGLNPASAGDPALDPDGDGLDNVGEFLAGRNPLADDAPLPVTTELLADGRLRLSFTAAAGLSYSVLAGPSPEALSELFIPFIADGPARAVEVTDRPDATRFYKIVAPARATVPPAAPVPGISRR